MQARKANSRALDGGLVLLLVVHPASASCLLVTHGSGNYRACLACSCAHKDPVTAADGRIHKSPAEIVRLLPHLVAPSPETTCSGEPQGLEP